MTIMDGVKLGIGLYIANNISHVCDGFCKGVYRGFKNSQLYNERIKPRIKKTNDEKVVYKTKSKNPVGFGHTYD